MIETSSPGRVPSSRSGGGHSRVYRGPAERKLPELELIAITTNSSLVACCRATQRFYSEEVHV